MNQADAVVGWIGLSLALVVGYGAYKNKPVFGPNGVVTEAIQTGKISSKGGASPSAPSQAPPYATPATPTNPPVGMVAPYTYQPFQSPSSVAAPLPPSPPSSPSPLSSLTGGIRSLLGI